MTTLLPDTRFTVRSSAVTWDEIGGEIVAINLESGHYFSLRLTARDLFVLWDAGSTFGAAIDLLDGAVAAEVAAFADDLLRAGLVEVGSAAATDAGPAADATHELHPYAPPQLETYTDLEDLMLLDPVHDVDASGWPHAVVDPG